MESAKVLRFSGRLPARFCLRSKLEHVSLRRMGGRNWDLETDLIAVGSGLGGLGAAIVGHDLGARVIVLEKAPKLGGVCAYSGGEVFVPCNHLQHAAGISDSR